MPKAKWTKSDIPPQNGKLAIVTGATGGLGYDTALALAEAGATVIVAGRNESKGKDAVDNIKKAFPDAKVSFGKVDLGSLASVAEFSRYFIAEHDQLDLLVNNAGVMMPPQRQLTHDGLELQFGTNHLSHFALTAQLLPALRKSPEARVVNVSSIIHRQGTINFEDLQFEKKYSPLAGYAQSKLCNLLFTLELQRRSDEGGWGLTCISAHPGVAKTDLHTNGPGEDTWSYKFCNYFLWPYLGHSCADGALSILFATTSPEATAKGYYGPNGFYELGGPPTTAYMTPEAKDPEVAKKLWDVSVSLSGVSWP